MATKFDSNTFEDDYVIAVLSHMVTDLKTYKSREQIIDHYAVELTAFMNGRIIEAVRNSTPNAIISRSEPKEKNK